MEEWCRFLCCAPTRAPMTSIQFLMLRMLFSVSDMTLSWRVMLPTRLSKSLSFMRQFRLQMGSYFCTPSFCFFSSAQRSKWISYAMQFSCRENCSTLRSMAFCSSTIFCLNFSIFSLTILMVYSCFLWCLNTRANFCSSIIILSRMEVLFTRSLPCNSAFLLRSRLSFRTCLIRAFSCELSRLYSSNKLGLEAKCLILSSSRLNSILKFCSRRSLDFFQSSSSTRVPSWSRVGLAFQFLFRLEQAFFSMWQSTSSFSYFRQARNFQYSFQIWVQFISLQLASLVMCSYRCEQLSWGLAMVGREERERPLTLIRIIIQHQSCPCKTLTPDFCSQTKLCRSLILREERASLQQRVCCSLLKFFWAVVQGIFWYSRIRSEGLEMRRGLKLQMRCSYCYWSRLSLIY